MVSKEVTSSVNNPTRHAGAYLSLISGLVVIGISPILVRVSDAPGPVSGFYRMAIGWLLLTPWFIQRQRANRYSLKQLRPAILGGLFFGGDLVLWTTGIMLAGATIPTLFGNTAPLWVGIGALVFFKEKLKPAFWLGLLMALAGAGLILGVGECVNHHLPIGVVLGLGGGVFYGSFFLAAQRGRENIDSLSFLWVVSFVSSVVLLLAALVLRQPLLGFSTFTYLDFLAMGLIIQVLGWLLISHAQGILPASLVSPTLLGQPVLTAILAVPLLGETLSSIEILGGLTVITGVMIVHFSKQNSRKPDEPIKD